MANLKAPQVDDSVARYWQEEDRKSGAAMSERVRITEDDNAIYIDITPTTDVVRSGLEFDLPSASEEYWTPPSFREAAGVWWYVIVFGCCILAAAVVSIVVGALL